MQFYCSDGQDFENLLENLSEPVFDGKFELPAKISIEDRVYVAISQNHSKSAKHFRFKTRESWSLKMWVFRWFVQYCKNRNLLIIQHVLGDTRF